jgi:predicted translin family RNA/ssDNA-binding protein
MKLFKTIASELNAYENRREQVIKVARDVLRDGKKVTFLCHEGKMAEAGIQLSAVTQRVKRYEKEFNGAMGKSKRQFQIYKEGSWLAAMEEYLESWFFYNFLAKGKLVDPVLRSVPAEVYIGALADFTGEVTRVAVMRGGKKDIKALEAYRRVVADVVAFMLPLYLTGQNRMKFDQAKKNLKRIEEITYEVNIRIQN